MLRQAALFLFFILPAVSFCGDVDELVAKEIDALKESGIVATIPEDIKDEILSLINPDILVAADNQSDIGDNITAPPNQNAKIILDISDRIYVFISSSIPDSTLQYYARDISRLNMGERVVMVMRGCIGGCEKARPTIEFIRRVVDNTTASVWIDPLLFKLYEVKEVPTVVYAKNIDTRQMGSEGLSDKPVFFKSAGDWSLNWHIREFEKMSGQALMVR